VNSLGGNAWTISDESTIRVYLTTRDCAVFDSTEHYGALSNSAFSPIDVPMPASGSTGGSSGAVAALEGLRDVAVEGLRSVAVEGLRSVAVEGLRSVALDALRVP
jgi:hypothetical protein